MAQQTQIARADEAWATFMERFPTPQALASASTAAVLRAWAGLGYNRRALALQRAASQIVTRHGGRVPADIELLLALPGVGPYTARAVAAVAYGAPVAAVDTNVRRVLQRLVGHPMPAADLQGLADQLVPESDPVTWQHASMDLGATVCRSREPRCGACPVAAWCASVGQADAVAAPVGRSAAGRSPAGRSPQGRSSAGRSRAGRSPSIPFEKTTRWLRGRIVAMLRDVDGDSWARIPASIGHHGHEEIGAALAALEQEGLLERRADGAVRLPSSVP